MVLLMFFGVGAVGVRVGVFFFGFGASKYLSKYILNLKNKKIKCILKFRL